MEEKTLIIWLANGKTLMFEKVSYFKEHADGSIGFKYFGVSTQVKRSARFIDVNVAGYALED